MKKLALAFVLLILLVGISYVSSMRSQAKLKQKYDQGVETGSKESVEATRRADSVSSVMNDAIQRYRDSLEATRSFYGEQSDSLQGLLAQKDSEITTLKQKARSTKSTKTATKPASTQAKLNHTQILDYYKRRLNDLPKDLSDYERKVALNELRDETAKKFSITLAELDKIRQSDSVKQ